MREQFFNAHHSPIGAFASFTTGSLGAQGGLGLELSGPANQNLFIGCESTTQGIYTAFPLYQGAADDRARYDVEGRGDQKESTKKVIGFTPEEIKRSFGVGIDAFTAKDCTFSIYSQYESVPEVEFCDETTGKIALVPAIIAKIELDNRSGTRDRTIFFGYGGNDPYSNMRILDCPENGIVGIGQGSITAIASNDPKARASLNFDIQGVLSSHESNGAPFRLGGAGALTKTIAAGKTDSLIVAICFYRSGIATAGLTTQYWYTRYFANIESVAQFACKNATTIMQRAATADALLKSAKLSEDRHFMLAHAIRSYFGSTQLLEHNGKPLWVVNEGEYRMMNTFDLTVDHLFFEMKHNPWTIRNVLDLFVDRYSYTDKIFAPDAPEKLYEGGISFTHDMGVGNCFSPAGVASYELEKLKGCFSYMTHEQLTNWILCAGVYGLTTGDVEWLSGKKDIFRKCFESMCHRDHPDASQRTGIMKFDSDKTKGGAEITTYDSLDVSLGQSRNNLYLAVKCWAAYVLLEETFKKLSLIELSDQSRDQAGRCAHSIMGFVSEKGYIPAVMGENNDSQIIPAIEGLVFPFVVGLTNVLCPTGPYAEFIQTLSHHFKTVLKPGVCLFADGGWKLSSTSDNSWLSKIYLCQFIAESVLKFPADSAADAAHVNWLLDARNKYFAWSDQMVSGEARGSKYYPRGVTAILWMQKN